MIPSLIELEIHLENLSKNFFDKQIINHMKEDLKTKFKSFKDPMILSFDPIFASATLFDPKFSLFLNNEQVKYAIQFIELLISKFEIKNDRIETESSENSSKEPTNINESNEQSSTLFNMIINVLNSPDEQESTKVSTEVESYLKYLKKEFLKDFNLEKSFFANLTCENDSKLTVYKFWSNQIIINKFPQISKVSCDILSIPATQASCERVFSISGDCLSTRRNSLKPTKLEREVMLICNKHLLDI